MECGKSLPHIQIKDRDTADVPLHATKDRGTRLHLLHGIESLQGTGAIAQTLGNLNERQQGTRTCTDNRDNPGPFASKQADNQQNHAHETSSTHRTTIH